MSSFSAEEIQLIIREIVQGFSSIDNKVMDLNDVSNQDFSALNAIFKSHYKTTKSISDSIAEVLLQAQQLANNDVFVDLKSLFADSQNFLNSTNEVLEGFYNEVTALNTDFKHVFIPILNFKQNISTLRFLLTNLKLNQGLIGDEVNPLHDDLAEELEGKISEIQSELPTIAGDIEHLKLLYSRMKQMFVTFMNDSIPVFTRHHNSMGELVQYAERSFTRAASIQNKINQKSKQGFENLNMVITNLQYHDIIRQKIEHIQITHRNILQELNSLEKGKKIIEKGLEYLKQIPGITEIQAGQLLLSNKEYQNAIENSSNKLIDSSKTLDELIALARSVFGDTKASEFSTAICRSGKSFTQFVQCLIAEIEDFGKLNTELQQHIHQQIEHYGKLSNIEEQISLIITDINTNTGEKNEINAITSKLVTLLNDIKESKEQIGKILKVHKGNSLNVFIETLTSAIYNVAGNLFSEENLTAFANEFNHIETRITENHDLYLTLDNQLKTTLGSIRYYDYYDVVVEEIINQLNLIYREILPMSATGESHGDLIASMKKAYTMQSQRDIHEHKDANELSETEPEDDDNLELF